MEFDMICCEDREDFIEAVNQYITEGWELYGNTAFISDGSTIIYHQAFTRIIEA